MTITVIGDNTGDDFSGTEDAYIWVSNPTTNTGSSTSLYTRYNTTTPDYINFVLKFSGLSNIAATEVVSATTLRLYRTGGDGTSGTVRFQHLLRLFVENQVTWNNYSTGNAWTTGGAESNGNDRSATITGDMSVGAAGSYYTISTAQLISDVQDEIDGTSTIHGWVGEQIDDDGTSYVFRPKNGTDGQRPYISVTHTTALAITKNNSMLAARNTRRMMRSYRSRGR